MVVGDLYYLGNLVASIPFTSGKMAYTDPSGKPLFVKLSVDDVKGQVLHKLKPIAGSKIEGGGDITFLTPKGNKYMFQFRSPFVPSIAQILKLKDSIANFGITLIFR